MRTSRWLAVVLMFTALLMTASCGQGAKIAGAAVDEAARAVGGQTRTLELSADQVESLARSASVREETIRAVAPNLDSHGLWRRSLTKAELIGQKFGPDVADVSMGVACDGLSGEIKTWEDLFQSLASNISGLAQPQLMNLANDTAELWSNMYTAYTTGTEQDKAAVVLSCYTVKNVRS